MNPVTKKGDGGFTENLAGERIPKNSPEIKLIGSLDELNSHLGLVKVKVQDNIDKLFMEKIQRDLMKLMAHVSDSSRKEYFFTGNETAETEKEIDKLNAVLPENSKLLIPGKSETEAVIHIARCAARKAERDFFAAFENKPFNPHAASFLNRLSDYLFVLSRKH